MRTERILGIIFLIAIACRLINFFPGFSMLILLSGGSLALLYFPVAFYFFSDKALKNQNIALSIIGGMVLNMACYGVIFKIMRWQGSNNMLIGALVGLVIVGFFVFILSNNAKDELKIYYKNYKLRVIVWLCLIVVFLPLSDRNILQIENRNDPKLLDAELKIMDAGKNGVDEHELNNYYHERDSLRLAADGYTNYTR